MYSQINIEIINNTNGHIEPGASRPEVTSDESVYHDEVHNDESYEFIFNTSNYICYDLKKNLLNDDLDLYYMKKKEILNENNIKLFRTDYNISLSINRFIGNEIRFLKNSNKHIYNINIIRYLNEDENLDKIIGIEYNNNKYYIYNQSNNINNYKNFKNDKSLISEIIKDSFVYYFKIKSYYISDINNYNLLLSFDNYYKKKFINYSPATINYMNLYQSAMLKFEIIDKYNEKGFTFLPINKRSFSNLFYKYQLLFQMLDSNHNSLNQSLNQDYPSNIKTFTNPKNDEFFNNNYYIKDTNYKFKCRLFCSKNNIHNSLFYRKTTEKKIYNIKFLLYNETNKIIGFLFNNTKYFIWKNAGDLTSYDTYNENNNFIELISNSFKDALVFLFKMN